MKISSLKFKQITNIVNNKSLKLNLFDKNDKLFEQDTRPFNKTYRNFDKFNVDHSKTSNRPKSRPRTSREHSRPRPCSSRKTSKPSIAQDCLFFLQKSLLDYIECISTQQRKSIRRQLQVLLGLLRMQSPHDMMKRFQFLQNTLSKRFKNRLVHLVFYLIYNKIAALGDRRIDKQIRNYIYCQYYSRKFNFKELALSICIQIQGLYCLTNNYEDSRLYARKSLRLAVVLGNQYYEAKMIQALLILNYYEGRLNEAGAALLSKEEKKRILEYYSQENELPNIFNLETAGKQGKQEQQSSNSFSYQGFNLQQHNNFIQNSIPNQNIKYFQTNYHEIIKSIPGKHINVRSIINKVSSVGVVRKYFGKDNYITLKPQCHVIKPKYQEQVLITHKKDGALSEQQHSLSRLLKRITGLLQYTIEAYAYKL